MKVALIWATPNELDPNRYLRPMIERALRKKCRLDVFDSACLMSKKSYSDKDLFLIIGTLHTMQLQVIDLISSKKVKKIYFWNLEDPYDFDSINPWQSCFNHIFTVEKFAVDYYEFAKASYLPLAGDPEIHARSETKKRNNKILIVGSDYKRRAAISNMIAEKFPENQVVRIGEVLSRNPNIEYYGRLDNHRISDLDNSFSTSIIIGRDFDFSNNEKFVPAGSPGPRLFESLFAGGRILVDRFSVNIEDTCPDLLPFVRYFYSLSSLEEGISDFQGNPLFDFSLQSAHMLKYHTYNVRVEQIFNKFRQDSF